MTEHPSAADERVRTTLRAQLRAEEARVGNGLVGPDGSAGPRRPASGPARWSIVVAAVALVVAAIGVGALTVDRDRTQRTETADESVGTSTTTPTTVATADTSTSPTTVGGSPDSGATTGPVVRTAPPVTGEPITVANPVTGFNRSNGYAVVQLDDGTGQVSFEAVNLVTGEVDAVLYSELIEASWFSPIELSPAGDAIYLSQGFEDSWYSCESSLPDLVRIPLDPRALEIPEWEGVSETIGQGIEPRISPDGGRLAYLSASDCMPDPANPGNWVLTPLDTIVVRDLATGEERRHTVPGIVEGATDGGDLADTELRGLVWLGDDRLGTSGGDILAVSDQLDPTPTGERLPALIEAGSRGRVLGHDPSTGSVMVELATYGDDGLTAFEVVAVDAASGERSILTAVTGITDIPAFWGAPTGLDITGQLPIVIAEGELVLPNGTAFPLPGSPISVDW